MTPVLELEGLSVTLHSRRKDTMLVDGVSLSVAAGECLGILGESGSGKSMSMKAAMGLLDKNFRVSGSVRFQGEELLGRSAEELRRLRGGKVGIVLQNPMTCFDPLYRVGAQISETFAAHYPWDTAEIRRRSLDMLNMMRIRDPEEVLEKYPHQLSGGMLQRIMIGIATAVTPELLIADEPTTAIDAITQFEILDELLRIKREHKVSDGAYLARFERGFPCGRPHCRSQSGQGGGSGQFPSHPTPRGRSVHQAAGGKTVGRPCGSTVLYCREKETHHA